MVVEPARRQPAEVLPPTGFDVPPELLAIHTAQNGPPFGPHIRIHPA